MFDKKILGDFRILLFHDNDQKDAKIHKQKISNPKKNLQMQFHIKKDYNHKNVSINIRIISNTLPSI